MAEIKNPYAVTKIIAATYAVIFRCMIGTNISFKRVCSQSSENDAKLIAKLLNENWSKKHE